MTSEAGTLPLGGGAGPDVMPAGYRGASPGQPLRHNEEVEWQRFDPQKYWEHNYRALRKDDKAIIHAVGAYFSRTAWPSRSRPLRRGIDVGSGPNLYPALTMLPWCDHITLTDIAPPNLRWLRNHAAGGAGPAGEGWPWQEFWDELRQFETYRRVENPAERLRSVQHVEKLSVFELPKAAYDVGTMFFVAESMTSYETEFEDATACFLNALRPRSPFAAAFMDSSSGYEVAGEPFPAVRQVNEARVRRTLDDLGARAEVTKIDVPASDPLRTGYDGMIIAVGTTSRT